MTTPGRLLDFFSLEASEYLARLEAMATKQGMQSSDATQFAAAARDLVPRLGDAPFQREWCGRRPAAPDGLPVIDRAIGPENLFLACGHYRNGVLLAPATGKLLSEWILSGRPSELLAPFNAIRFPKH